MKNYFNHPHYIAFVAASIDGRISLSEKHPPDWTSKEDWDFFQNSLEKMDAVVVGRHTYDAVTERLRKRNTFVLSRRLKSLIRRGTVTFVNPQNVDLPKLFEKYKKIGIIGGGSIYRFMLEQELLDEIYLTLEPFIFGRGKQMFIDGTGTHRVELISIKKLNKKGTLLLHYRVIRKERTVKF